MRTLYRDVSLSLALGTIASVAPAQLQASFASSSGPPVTEFAEAYDSARNVSVLFGGRPSLASTNDVYEWNGTSWTQRFPGTRPSNRNRAAMAFDEARGVCLIFGGSPVFGSFLNDTWTWNGNSFQNVSSTGPSLRSGAAMAYDPVRQTVVLFGGFVPSGADDNQTWEWNGTSWTRRFPSSSPPARGAHRMVWDARNQRIVMFGGFSTPQSSTLSDTWTWNGTTWTQLAGTAPQQRCDQAMTYDSSRGRVLMFGGVTAFQPPTNFPVVIGDYWELDGNTWRAKSVGGSSISARGYTFAAYDSSRQEIVLHGGVTSFSTLNQTYTLSTNSPGSLTAFGMGCAGSTGTPTLDVPAGSAPWVGDSFDVVVNGAPATSVFGIMVIGFSDQIWMGQPLPVSLSNLGLPGCDTYISVDDTSPVPLSGGSGTWTGVVSNSTSLIGFNFYLQAGVLDAGVSRPVPASVTNAVAGTIGIW